MNIVLPKGGMVIGVGADLIEVERVRRAHQRHGERFLKRILTGEEQAYCFGMSNPYPHFAARFAAKEAVSKAFTTGIGAALGWTSVWVHNGGRGQPVVRLDAKGRALLRQVGGSEVLLTLSHTAGHAQAVALIVRRPRGQKDNDEL